MLCYDSDTHRQCNHVRDARCHTQPQAALDISSSRIEVSSVQEDMSVTVTISGLATGLSVVLHRHGSYANT